MHRLTITTRYGSFNSEQIVDVCYTDDLARAIPLGPFPIRSESIPSIVDKLKADGRAEFGWTDFELETI